MVHFDYASIIIPTKNAGGAFSETLKAVFSQEYSGGFEVIVVDSGSTDGTIDTAKNYPISVVTIKPDDFGHGKTRNLAAGLAKGRYLIFLTQDAIPSTTKWLSKLIGNFEEPTVAAVYGRQIPQKDTKPMEYFFLGSNYPSYRIVKQAEKGKTDINLIFFSDVNSAYRRELWEDQPFNEALIVSEESEFAKRMLVNGYKIVYEPEAPVYHSHNFSLRTVFQKYFDIGVSFSHFANDEYSIDKFTVQGLQYVCQEMKFLLGNGYVKWLPYAVLYDLAKFLGVMLGKKERWLPLRLKEYLSKHSYFWRR